MNVEILARIWAANRLPALVPFLRKRYPQALWMGNPHLPYIALTFDDGPHPQDTPELLETLERHRVRATFFVLGEQVYRFPELIRAVAAAGHQIGLHGFRHEPFPLVRPADLRSHLDTTRDLISVVSGYDTASLRYVRPPYGIFLAATLNHLVRWQYRPVICNILPLHWLQPAETTLRQVLAQATGGALLVLHEGQSGPPVAHLTDVLVSRLKAEGFAFITVDRMWQTASIT